MKIKSILFVVIVLMLSPIAKTQTVDLSVVSTIDGVINEGLNIVSGKRGENRDWEAFRQLFTDNAQISVLVHDSLENAQIHTYSLEQFVRIGMQFYEKDGFIEYEMGRTIEEYNGVATVFQSYYAKELGLEEEGINTYQLIFDGKRWWISSLLWTSNRNGVEVPSKYK
jgi:hypothetical protein